MNNITLNEIFSRVGVVLGRTGGKGVFISSYETGLSSQGVKLIKLASGDCFRKAKKTNPDLAARMDSGKLIEDHNDIRDELKSKIKEFLVSLAKGDNVELVLDGFERLGKDYVYQEKEGFVGQKAESQISQIASCFVDVISDLYKNDIEFFTKLSPELIKKLSSESYWEFDTDLSSINTTVEAEILTGYTNARRYLINTTSHNSEAFQRGRSVSALSDLLGDLKKHGVCEAPVQVLEKVKALQEGRFKVTYEKDSTGKKKQKLTVDIGRDANTLRSLNWVSTEAFDQEMKRLCDEFDVSIRQAGEKVDSNKSLQDNIQLLVSKADISANELSALESKIKAVRVDDLLLDSRRRRDKAFREDTERMLLNDLGYKKLETREAKISYGVDTRKDNPIMAREGAGVSFVNGPDYGVDLNSFKAIGSAEGVRIGMEHKRRASNIEGQHVSRERSL